MTDEGDKMCYSHSFFLQDGDSIESDHTGQTYINKGLFRRKMSRLRENVIGYT